MTDPRASSRRRPLLASTLLLAAALTAACGDDEKGVQGARRGEPARPPVADRPWSPEPPAPPPTPKERAGYWLDRLVKGPEPIEAGAFQIAYFHQALLEDSLRNLVDLGPVSLDLLADPALLARVTKGEDANPWHGILDVLLLLGKQRPEVARAWAVPALTHPLLTLRRRALPVIAALADPADAPLLLDSIRKDSADRNLSPTAFAALFRLGPPWDARAAKAVFERGGADLWLACVDAVAGSDRPAAVRADFLAWWAALAGGAGPLASGGVDAGKREVLASDPAAGPVVGPEHALTSGDRSAAAARSALGASSFPAYVESLREDAASLDPGRSRSALLRLARAKDPRALARVRKELEAGIAALGPDLPKDLPPSDPDLASLATALEGDESPESTDLLERLLAAARPATAYESSCVAAFEALEARHVDVEARLLQAFRSGRPSEASFASMIVRRERRPAHVALVRSVLSGEPAGPRRHELRSLLLWLTTGALEKGGVDPEALAAFARELMGWVAEGGSERGFASGLLDLGPPGEAALSDGLKGADRAAYVAALGDNRRYVAPPVVEALLGPIGMDTPEEERRAALSAAFRSAPANAVASFEALMRRLRAPERAEVEWILRIVRFHGSILARGR